MQNWLTKKHPKPKNRPGTAFTNLGYTGGSLKLPPFFADNYRPAARLLKISYLRLKKINFSKKRYETSFVCTCTDNFFCSL